MTRIELVEELKRSGFRFYKDMIAKAAVNHGLNAVTVAAIVWKESTFNADAYRFEPNFWNRYLKGNPKFTGLNPRRVSASYGLMQVMYPLVFEDKIAENDALPPEHLFVPENSLDVGCRHFRSLISWVETRTTDQEMIRLAALASYNGGRGGNDPRKDAPLRNEAYARAVLLRRSILQEREYGPK